MSLPTDLPHAVAARAPQPGFDEVLARAGTRRRRSRTTAASALAAVVVVAGAAVALDRPGGDGRTEPTGPSPSSPTPGVLGPDRRLPSDVVAVLDDDRLQLWSVTGGEDGTQAALWRGCDAEPCRFAVVARDGDDVSGVALGASYPTVTPVPGGWLVEDVRGATRLSPTGDRAEIFTTGPGDGDVAAGDTAVPTTDGWRLLRGDKLIPVPRPPSGAEVVGAYVDGSGRLVVAGRTGSGITVSATGDGRTWDGELPARVPEPVASAVVAGSGDHVAVALLGDDPDGSIPVVGVLLSADAGRNWTGVDDLDTTGGDRVRNLSSLAVAADGTTYLATESHHLVRIDEDGDVLPIQLSSFDSSVFADGAGVCVVTERGRRDQLACSDDRGTTWSSRPLPGFR